MTPSFNQVQYLPDCLHSVLAQDYPNLEYLVIDGGSTDGSLETLKKLGDRLAYWVSEPDQGQAQAVNKGWARASGEVLGWVNSDDLLTPGALARVSASYLAHPGAALIFGDVQEINAAGRLVRTKSMAGFDLRSLILGKNMGQPGVFVSRRAYSKLGGLDESLHYALDFDFFLRAWLAPSAGDFVYVPAVLAASRLWTQSKTGQNAAGFGAEYRRVLDVTFQGADLPQEIKSLKERAYSRAFLFRQARLYFQARKNILGLAWLTRSVVREPNWIEKAHMMWFGLRCLLGLERGEA